MENILHHLPPDRLLELGIAIGFWLAMRLMKKDRDADAMSRRSQGERLGGVEDRVSRLEGKTGATPPGGSDGR
jgi:hypothetical protein